MVPVAFRLKVSQLTFRTSSEFYSRSAGDTWLAVMAHQRAVAMLREAIYEQDFLDCSYGFRPGRSPHAARPE
jgi:hypothetical protein